MKKYPVLLEPLGETVEVEPGTPLQDFLFAYGVEFPCGGAGQCRGCRVKVLTGQIAVTPEMEEVLDPQELAAGWRLACQATVEGPVTLEIGAQDVPILSDASAVELESQEGLGIAVDLGTTTIVAQLLDLASGEVLAVQTALNAQAVHGADVMSRIGFAMSNGSPDGKLTRLIREQIAGMTQALMHSFPADAHPLMHVSLAGNTVMHHLFCGINVEPLSHAPFEPVNDGLQLVEPGLPTIEFLPCLGGMVGSDILAGIAAVGMLESDRLVALMDLGTNGEVAAGNRDRVLCASTAAGPAFEAGRISMGMRADKGAIDHVSVRHGRPACHVLGGGSPRGICGSGLVDAVAAGLDCGLILPSGRLAGGAVSVPLLDPVALTQRDVRELQLAKAAVAAGLRIVLEKLGASPRDLAAVHLAGAFGNCVTPASARRIGLIETSAERVEPSGNTSLRGIKKLMLAPSRREVFLRAAAARIEHIPLGSDPRFQDTFADCMGFPEGSLEFTEPEASAR